MREDIAQHLPKPSQSKVLDWISNYNIEVRISKKRHTKLGDYRIPRGGKTHRITVNGDLNKYGFLITFLHEFAHLLVYEENGSKVKPHGKEWKRIFKYLMTYLIRIEAFPKDLAFELENDLQKITATSSNNLDLNRILRKYNNEDNDFRMLEDLDTNTYFKIHNGRLFQKGERLRKRFKCVEVNTKKTYYFSPVAEVIEENRSSDIKADLPLPLKSH